MGVRPAPKIHRIDFAGKDSFFQQIVQAVEEAIASHEFPPGAVFPSIPQMARHQGVSQKPVQQAYRYLVEHGILVSRSGQGTRVHKNALAGLDRLHAGSCGPRLATSSRALTSCVGMLVPTVESSLHSAITKMIETRLYDQGRHLILGNYEENLLRLKKYVQSLADRDDCETIILSPFRTDFSRRCMGLLKAAEDRLLLLANRVEGLDCPCLLLDNEKGGFIGARHLYERGHRRVLFMSGPENNAGAAERERGARKFFDEIGSGEMVIARGDFFQHRAYQQTIKWFRGQRPFSAVHCVNSLSCVGALKALNDLRIRIPEEVSVITFDDMEYPTSTPMTVIRQPLSLMADKVVSLVMSRKEWNGADVRFAPELIERESVAVCGSCFAHGQ